MADSSIKDLLASAARAISPRTAAAAAFIGLEIALPGYPGYLNTPAHQPAKVGDPRLERLARTTTRLHPGLGPIVAGVTCGRCGNANMRELKIANGRKVAHCPGCRVSVPIG